MKTTCSIAKIKPICKDVSENELLLINLTVCPIYHMAESNLVCSDQQHSTVPPADSSSIL